jgi:hypothetical protein
VIGSVEAHCEREFTVLCTKRDPVKCHQISEVIDLDVPGEISRGLWIRFEHPSPCSTNTGGQYGVGSNIPANIKKEITLT